MFPRPMLFARRISLKPKFQIQFQIPLWAARAIVVAWILGMIVLSVPTISDVEPVLTMAMFKEYVSLSPAQIGLDTEGNPNKSH